MIDVVSRPLGDVLSALTREDEQVRRVFEGGSADAIEQAIRTLVRRASGADVDCCLFDYVSVGMTLELELRDGRVVVFKALPHDPSRKRAAAIATQAALGDLGFPAPRVLAPLTRCLEADAYLMEVCDRGEQVRYDERVRNSMARTLARLVDLAATIDPPPLVPERGYVSERLWPTPHSAIFDIEGTTATASPIDAIASRARERLVDEPGRVVVAHGDWSLQNMAFRDGEPVCVFDWDSVALMPEPLVAASAAAFHQQDWLRTPDAYPHDFYPGPEVAMSFVATYAAARGFSWTRSERLLIEAALVYRLGYQARCEHALDPAREGPALLRLRTFAEAFDL